jgi:hypothetical protein
VKGSAGVESYPVGGIELRSEGDDLVVRFEHDGKWYEAFREGREGPIHHTFHANGIKTRIEGKE